MEKIKYKLLITFAALLLNTTSGKTQNYSCIDYNRINAASECKFDLYIGELKFEEGIIRPENTLKPHEINQIINEVLLEYVGRQSGGRATGITSVSNPCAIIDPFNKDISAMLEAFGENYWQTFGKIYDKAIADLYKNVASSQIPTPFTLLANLASGDIPGVASDFMYIGNAGDFYTIFFGLLQSQQEYQKFMEVVAKNKDAIEKGRYAEQALNEFYNDIYDAIKKKMGKMRWNMTMKSFANTVQTKQRIFWDTPVMVDYVLEKMHLEKVVNTENFEGMYKGDIVIRIDNMQHFDERFPKTNKEVQETVDKYYKKVPQGKNMKYNLRPNKPTTFKQYIRFENVIINVEQGKCPIKGSAVFDKEDFSFDYIMNSNGCTSVSYLSDKFSLKSTKITSIDIKFISGTQEYFTPVSRSIHEAFYSGWGGDIMKPTECDFLKGLKNGFVIVYPTNEKLTAIDK